MPADSMVMRANVMEAYRDDADGLRRWLAEPELEDLWKEAFQARLRAGQRDAVRLYAEARKLVNSSVDVAVLVMQAVGTDTGRARAAVDMAQRVRDASPEDIARAALEALDEYCGARGLTVDEARASLAVHANGNGGTP